MGDIGHILVEVDARQVFVARASPMPTQAHGMGAEAGECAHRLDARPTPGAMPSTMHEEQFRQLAVVLAIEGYRVLRDHLNVDSPPLPRLRSRRGSLAAANRLCAVC